MVEHLSDEELEHLHSGGHDYRKLRGVQDHDRAQRQAAVVLAKTVKGWTLGTDFEARATPRTRSRR